MPQSTYSPAQEACDRELAVAADAMHEGRLDDADASLARARVGRAGRGRS